MQGIPPVGRDFDGVLVWSFLFGCHPLGLCMLDELSHVVRVDGVEDVPEKFALREPPFRSPIWQVDHDFGEGEHFRVHILHRQLVVLWDLHKLDFVQR